MATGDKLFLADKPTLDNVKSSVESIKTAANSTKTAVDQANSKLDTLMNSDRSSDEVYTLDSISKLNYLSSSASGTTTALSLTQPGTLYLVTLEFPVGYQTSIQVVVDGTNVYSMNFTATNAIVGSLVTPPAVLGVTSDNRLMLITGMSVAIGTSPTLTPLTKATNNFNVYSPKPIKWNNSIQIRITVAGTAAASYNIYYKLD